MSNNFVIRFETNGDEKCTTARIRVETGLPCERNNILFEFECIHQYAAQLLVKHCREQLAKSVENLARECYELGWKDKSSKRRKRRYFVRFLNYCGSPGW